MPVLRSRVRFPVIPLSLPKFLFDSNVSMKPSLIGLYRERPLKLSLTHLMSNVTPDSWIFHTNSALNVFFLCCESNMVIKLAILTTWVIDNTVMETLNLSNDSSHYSDRVSISTETLDILYWCCLKSTFD